MEILLKNNVKVELRKLFKRSGEITKPLRQASALGRNKLSQQKVIVEASSAIKKSFTKRFVPTIVTYPVSGANAVEDISYVEPGENNDKGMVWINQAQYFENVPPNVWNFCVGNYCVCQKWLKIRVGTTLEHHNIQDYQRLVMLISETIDLIDNVDSQLINKE